MSAISKQLLMARAVRRARGVRCDFDFEVDVRPGQWSERDVPIIINSFDRLTYLKQLVDALRSRGFENIYVIDNCSTYGPLLDYYASERLRVFRLSENVGYLALWATPVQKQFAGSFYVYTDSDIVPADRCPDDFITRLKDGLDRYPEVSKVGLGLVTDDLPRAFALRDAVIEHERGLLGSRHLAGGFQAARIDTTFALYRPNAAGGSWLRALRTSDPYVARHLPWYEDSARPSAEEIFYREHVRTSTHWSVRGNDTSPELLEVLIEGESATVAAGAFDDHWNEVSKGEWRPELFEAIDRFVGTGNDYLEIGPGPGQTVLYAASSARSVFTLATRDDASRVFDTNVGLNAAASARTTVRHFAQGPGGDDLDAAIGELARDGKLEGVTLVAIDTGEPGVSLSSSLMAFLRQKRPALCVTLRPGARIGLSTSSAWGRALVGALGVCEGLWLMWRLRFYDGLYLAPNTPLAPWGILSILSSTMTIVACDGAWPQVPHASAQTERLALDSLVPDGHR